MNKIETLLTPALFHQIDDVEQKIVVVIDILRASSTITAILANGATEVRTVADVEEAQNYRSKGMMVGGERGGQKIAGFDFGNSPLEYSGKMVQGKGVVLTTTNGTKCVEMSQKAAFVYIGSFLSLDSLIDILKESGRDIILFCAGWKESINLEDSLFAGAVVNRLSESYEGDDSSKLAALAYKNAEGSLFESLKGSNHYQRLSDFGNDDDIRYCCSIDALGVVPVLHGGVFIKA